MEIILKDEVYEVDYIFINKNDKSKAYFVKNRCRGVAKVGVDNILRCVNIGRKKGANEFYKFLEEHKLLLVPIIYSGKYVYAEIRLDKTVNKELIRKYNLNGGVMR